MYETQYLRASNVAQAETLLRNHPEARLLAGGHTLIPTLKQRLARPSHLIDVSRLAELRGITVDTTKVVIGAATKHFEVAGNSAVQRAIPGLAALAGCIGDPHVRHMGTIGGSLANNDPVADYPAAALGLDAVIETARRKIKASDFFTDLFETALENDEILTRITFPIPKRSAYEKFRNRASHYAMVGVFVAELADGSIRVAVTGAGPCVFRATDIEAALKNNFTPKAAEAVPVNQDGLSSDMHASAEYRAHLIPVLAARAVAAAG